MGLPKPKYGIFGGRFVPETLMEPLLELEAAFYSALRDKNFWKEFEFYLEKYCGRPTPLYPARNLSRDYGLKVYLKREDLNHTGAHKINNCLGQALLARKMNKKRIIAETGAGQHGFAVATVAALFGFKCTVYMGEVDASRQSDNVMKMKLLGAEVVEVSAGSRTLKEATSEAMRDWATHPRESYYLLGSAVGPHPYPLMVRTFQSVIGKETRKQIIKEEGRLPDYLVACVGGGSNAIGLFYPFLSEKNIRMIGVEAAGQGTDSGRHALSLSEGKEGIFHGAYTFFLQDEDGQVLNSHSISAGLDYPGVGPEIAFLVKTGKITVEQATDEEVLRAFEEIASREGIIAALESCHALAWLRRHKCSGAEEIAVVNLSGSGYKDLKNLEVQHEEKN